MKFYFAESVIAVGAFILGGLIGIAFGALQNKALMRNQKHQGRRSPDNPWLSMSGSLRRTTFLLVALVIVQAACPIFFESVSTMWVVSGGVVVGYGWTLLKNVFQKAESNA